MHQILYIDLPFNICVTYNATRDSENDPNFFKTADKEPFSIYLKMITKTKKRKIRWKNKKKIDKKKIYISKLDGL